MTRQKDTEQRGKKGIDKQQRRKNGKKKPLRKLLDRQIEKIVVHSTALF